MSLTRRQFVIGGVAITAFLAGCGQDEEAATSDEAPSGGFPRTVQTGLGPITIPVQPKRIVTLGYEASVVLDLGLVPVGMAKDQYDPTGIPPYNRQPISGHDVMLLDTVDGVPFEQVAALRPDVILAGTYFELDPAYDQLKAIAPVVGYRQGTYEDTWQEHAGIIGEALGEEAGVAAAVSALEERIAGIAASHPSWAGKTFSLSFNFDVGQVTTITKPDDFAIRLLSQLGFVLSPSLTALTQSGAAGNEQPILSYERLDALDADVMFLAHASDELRRNLEGSPVFGSLPVVRDGRYVFVDVVTVAALRTPMLRGIGHSLDQLVPALERVVR